MRAQISDFPEARAGGRRREQRADACPGMHQAAFFPLLLHPSTPWLHGRLQNLCSEDLVLLLTLYMSPDEPNV